MSDKSDPSGRAVAVTASDSTSLLLATNDANSAPRAVYVGGAGNVNVQFGNAVSVLFSNVPAGAVLPIRPHKVMSTSTTATSIVAIY